MLDSVISDAVSLIPTSPVTRSANLYCTVYLMFRFTLTQLVEGDVVVFSPKIAIRRTK